MQENHWDVVIIGGGLAGLTLARQLLLYTDKRILQLERMETLPRKRQKVGESTVQVAGFHYGKVLDLEEYMFQEQLMKYNLRFTWPSAGDRNKIESYSNSYIRKFSNIPCYQLDRNRFEGDLIKMNRQSDRYTLLTGVADVEPEINPGSDTNVIRYKHEGQDCQVTADWIVDNSGRVRVLARQMDLRRPSRIKHSTAFFWMEGLTNMEKLTDTPQLERVRDPQRKDIGHLPVWLATNHLVGEGYWFWLIPIKYLTSFGLVFAQDRVDTDQVDTEEKLMKWLFDRYPMLRREFEGKKIIDFTFMRNYTHDCDQTISSDRWAMSGESGRFSDPLYSPGSDLISLYNTLITDAICTESQEELEEKLVLFEALEKTAFHAFMPTYDEGYPPLGDQEAFSLKYGWELSIYFSYIVFPFMNGLFTDTSFLPGYLRRLSQLGKVNRTIQGYIAEFFEWKKGRFDPPAEPINFDFTWFEALNRAEECFYLTGSDATACHDELDRQMKHLREFALWIIAHIDSVVLEDPNLVTSADYHAGIDITDRKFDPEAMRAQAAESMGDAMTEWNFEPMGFRQTFHPEV